MSDITNLGTKAALNTKVTENKKEIPGKSAFSATSKFSRLGKISFNVRMKEATKILAIKSQVDNALDIAGKADKNKKTSNV